MCSKFLDFNSLDMDIITIIISVVSGIVGGVLTLVPTLLFFKSDKRKRIAEITAVEIANDKDYIQIYKDLVEEYRKLVCYKNTCNERII